MQPLDDLLLSLSVLDLIFILFRLQIVRGDCRDHRVLLEFDLDSLTLALSSLFAIFDNKAILIVDFDWLPGKVISLNIRQDLLKTFSLHDVFAHIEEQVG